MNFIKRALKNVARSKTKAILLAITFFVIGNLVIIGLGVSYASENAKKMTRLKMKPVIKYTVDYNAWQRYIRDLSEEEMEEAYNNFPRLRSSDFEKILDNEHVEAANDIMELYGYSDGFDPIPGENNNSGSGGVVIYDDVDMPSPEEYEYREQDCRILANHMDNMVQVAEGTYEITSGHFYSKDDIKNGNAVCLITEELARANNLTLGSRIRVDVAEPYIKQMLQDDTIETTVDFEIVGIYKNTEEISENESWRNQFAQYRNENVILCPDTCVKRILVDLQNRMWDYYASMWPEDEYYSNPENRPTEDDMYNGEKVILLDDPLYVEEFVKENADKIPQFTKLDANDDMFNRFAKPLDTMSLFSNIIVWIVVINAVVIITLVTALTMKNREHEIGILLSMGVSKIKVVGQLFLELAIVAIIGFTLAVASGSLISRKVGQVVLDYQMTTRNPEEEDYYYYGEDDYFTTITQEDMLSEYDVKINPVIIGEIYALGLGVVFVSTLIPSFMIMRFNPKKILTDAN